jgi:hypothetical protein
MTARRSSARAAPSPVVFGCLALGTLPLAATAGWAGIGAATAFLSGDRRQALGLAVVMFMLLVLGGALVFIVWAVSTSRAARQDLAMRRRNHPDAPWMWREDWARGEVVHLEGTAAIVFLGAFAVVWNVVVLIAVVALGSTVGADDRFFLFGLLGVFVVAGLFLVSMVVQMILRRVRYGRSVFSLDALPATPGGQLSGVVHVPEALSTAAAFEVTLFHIAVIQGENTTENVKWQDALTLAQSSVDRGPHGIMLPVAFDIPADATPTSPLGDDERRILWRLTVKAALRGVDYDAAFEVPVFHADAPQQIGSRRMAQARARPLAPHEVPQPVTSRIRVEPTNGGTALQFPTPPWLYIWTLVPLLFVPAAAWLGNQPFLSTVPYDVVLGASVAATLFCWGLTFLGLIATPNRIEVLHDRVLVRRGLGRHGWDRTMQLSDVKTAVARTAGSQGQAQHSVDILTTSGGEYWAAIGLRDASEAKWLAGEIERLVRAAQGA